MVIMVIMAIVDSLRSILSSSKFFLSIISEFVDSSQPGDLSFYELVVVSFKVLQLLLEYFKTLSIFFLSIAFSKFFLETKNEFQMKMEINVKLLALYSVH